MKQSHSEAESYSASHKIPCLL